MIPAPSHAAYPDLPAPATATPVSTPGQSRFSLRSSISSVFKGVSSSVYSRSTAAAPSSSTRRSELQARSRPSLPFSAPRFSSNSSHSCSFRGAPRAIRSRSSTRSLIDASVMPQAQPLRLPDRVHEDSPFPENSHRPDIDAAPLSPSAQSLQDLVLEQEARLNRGGGQDARHNRYNRDQINSRWSKIFSRRAFQPTKVRTKATMAAAFGFTLISALAVYLSLTVAGIGVGPMYHTLFILLILALTAVFCHSLLRMFMVILHPADYHSHYNQYHHSPSSRRRGRNRDREFVEDGVMPEKPIPIIMASDEDEEAQFAVVQHQRGTVDRAVVLSVVPAAVEKVIVRPPPPIYGEYRSSKRMNPSLVHWQKQEALPPSPLTPTYDEAISDLQPQNVLVGGFRPPSYVSEGGIVVVGGEQEVAGDEEMDVGMGMGDLHPLERERVRGLIGLAV